MCIKLLAVFNHSTVLLTSPREARETDELNDKKALSESQGGKSKKFALKKTTGSTAELRELIGFGIV